MDESVANDNYEEGTCRLSLVSRLCFCFSLFYLEQKRNLNKFWQIALDNNAFATGLSFYRTIIHITEKKKFKANIFSGLMIRSSCTTQNTFGDDSSMKVMEKNCSLIKVVKSIAGCW